MMACQAGSCGGGCSPAGLGGIMGAMGGRPSARNFMLADRVDIATRAQKGQTVQVRMDSIPNTDSEGRIAHILGIRIDFGVQYDAVAATMPGAYPGENLAAVLENFFLEDVDGHQYLAGVNGQDLVDDTFFRGYRLPVTVAADIADADATDATANCSLYVPFTRRDWHGPQLEGAIPLSALTCRGPQAFRFSVRTGTTLPGDSTGLTYDGLVQALDGDGGAIKVWLDVVYLPGVYVSRPWQVESYTVSDMSGTLRHCERCHEYVVIRKHLGDDGDAPEDLTLSGYTGMTVQADGNVVFAGLDQVDLDARTAYFPETDPDAEPDDLPLDAGRGGSAKAIIILPQARRFRGMACGVVSFQITSRGSDDNTRFLHRTVAGQRREHAGTFRRAAGLPPTRAIAITPDMTLDPSPSPESTIFVPASTGAGAQSNTLVASAYQQPAQAGVAKPYDLI